MAVFRPQYKDPKTGETKRTQIWHYKFIFARRLIKESAKKRLRKSLLKKRRSGVDGSLRKASTVFRMFATSGFVLSGNSRRLF
jgi:hypothetical protein